MQTKKRLWKVWLYLALAASLLAACTAGGRSAVETQAPGMGEAEFDQLFIDMIVPYHQGAVEMAKIAQERAEHAEIQAMADAIIAGQEEEITQMKTWRQQWYGSGDTPPMSAMPSLEEMPGMGGTGHAMDMQADVERLKNAPEPFDLAFIDAMIPHHQSAIDAARMALSKAQRSEIKELAQKIIDAQQKEIDEMNAWRKAWYPDAPPASAPGH